jgi:hypothetical protein
MNTDQEWEVSGSYYEACNCEAVCPCRQEGEGHGNGSAYDTCDFAVSWKIDKGHKDGRDLAGLSATMVGSFRFAEPGIPWRVAMFVDETADEARQQDLADIFLGRIDGDSRKLYGQLIQEVTMVRPAAIDLVHERGRWRIGINTFVEVRSTVDAVASGPVTCGLTDNAPGTEMISDVLTVDVPPFEWNLRERCSFQSIFDYRG